MKRFTEIELKHHRDNMYRMIREGILLPEEEPIVRYETAQTIVAEGLPPLIPEAVNLLVGMATGDGFMYSFGGNEGYGSSYTRGMATQHEAFQQLLRHEFIRHNEGDLYVLTLKGYVAADGYIAMMNAKN